MKCNHIRMMLIKGNTNYEYLFFIKLTLGDRYTYIYTYKPLSCAYKAQHVLNSYLI